jgi:hypothetical protein
MLGEAWIGNSISNLTLFIISYVVCYEEIPIFKYHIDNISNISS